ncbi:MAG: Gfo/Idh/MocA family oxidoreductase [Bryobacterales bacterium]|nr:Gfo/Idh/MocA family oxidoreductase [Bryobacterales bacterium]
MNVSRRTFLSTGAAGAVWTAKSYSAVIGANDRIRMGVIGCGGMAQGHMEQLVKIRDAENFEFTGVCDLYDKRRDIAKRITGAKTYQRHQDLLAASDIDYVLIATPEHRHFDVAMDAVKAGKHIYLEKPMTKTSGEGVKLAAAVKSANVKLQVGVQGTSDQSYITARKYVEDGTLGDIVMAQIDYSRNYSNEGDFWAYPIDEDAKPGVNIDWNAWLGSAPKRPYDADRFFRWRRYWDYSSGISSDLFVHRATRIIKALNLGFPQYAVGVGGTYHFRGSKAEIPDTFNIMLDYPKGPTVSLVSSMANGSPIRHMIRGSKATLTFTREGFDIEPERHLSGSMKPIHYDKVGAENTNLHHKNLMNAIRRGEELNCDADLGLRAVVACELGTLSFRQRRYMRWDPAKMKPVAG